VNKDSDLTEDENSASFRFRFLAISSIINKNAILLSSTTQFHVKRSRRLTVLIASFARSCSVRDVKHAATHQKSHDRKKQ